MHQKLTITAWAASVGISRQAGHKAIKRCGIPLDAAGLVDPTVATFLYKQRTQYRTNPRRMADVRVSREVPAAAAAPMSQPELLELAHGIADLMVDAKRPHLFDEGLPYLMATLAQMDDAVLAVLRLPAAVVEGVHRRIDEADA